MLNTLNINRLTNRNRKEEVPLPVSNHELELLSRRLNQAHHAAIQAELNAAGLREVCHPMLLSILQSYCDQDEEGKCHAQSQLAQALHVSPAAVANSLKSLEKSGYIRREPGAQDARRNQIIVTEKGAQAVEGCLQAFERVSQRMLCDFSPQEKELLQNLQQRMLQNLSKTQETEV
jgi:DNA-binding MarR family transcriptional regulator